LLVWDGMGGKNLTSGFFRLMTIGLENIGIVLKVNKNREGVPWNRQIAFKSRSHDLVVSSLARMRHGFWSTSGHHPPKWAGF
jgi:hypothetical protein